jgi:hypothetical protein
MKRFLMLLGVVPLLFTACEEVNPEFRADAADPEYFHRSVKQLTDVIVHDIFSPPVAARIYAYPSIAAYEVMAKGDPNYQTLAGQLSELDPVPAPTEEICYPLAAVQAYLNVGKSLIFSEEKIDQFELDIMAEFAALDMPSAVYDNSIAYGNQVADHIREWSGGDMYKQTRTYPKYSITDEPGRWQPTPPDYMDGIEPSWNQIRTMVLDSAQQFKPAPPTAYSEDPNSQWWKEAMEVYDAVSNAPQTEKEERTAVAKFWDCNPYVSHHTGHVMFATKKITPGGHWIGITSIATRQAEADFMETVEAYTLTSIALFDAFISCWDEKYRSNLVRPETFINQFIDEDWLPVLQTPPFPEHTSGHSVISRAAAVALTTLYGEDFAFTDTTEEEYGLPPRSFTSFYHASDEAAISRLYGGIHYRPAIYEGVKQGEAVGAFIIDQLQLRTQYTDATEE